MSKYTKLELEDLLKELESHKGKHTELITVYIASNYDPNTVQKQLEGEKSTAKNIKSATTRKNVIEALEKIIRYLKPLKKVPDNGIALFCGNISPVEGQQDLQLWDVEPPLPLKTRLYRCDKEFVLEPLREMLEVDEVFGLLVMDRKEATIGMLEGKRIAVMQKMTSGIPSKVRAGGQCLSSDTLIMKDNGEIIEIDKSHNPLLILSENFNTEKTEETPLIVKWENNKELFKITTKYPRVWINASNEHTFFVRTENGLEEKPLSEIKEGDYLIMPERINLNLENQDIDFSPIIKQDFNLKKINIPKKIDYNLAKILGYYLGDGSYELNRITFSEQRKEVAEYYQKLIEETFYINSKLKFREDKNYWQLRVYSRIISQLFNQIFQERDKTLKERIPSIVLKSSDNALKGFISGFFDAEGYISGSRVALGINNSIIARQLQFVLLRLGIISSIQEYDNNKNPYSKKVRYTVSIEDIDSLKKFQRDINFSSIEKKNKLIISVNNRSSRNGIRQLVVNGKEIARIIRNSGLTTGQFGCPDFFNNKKQLSKEIFKKNILNKVDNQDLKRRLEMFYSSNLIVVKINKIESLGIKKTIDIETKNHNFIANGLIVHNSAARFSRVTEGLTKEFYKRIADEMKTIFFEMPKLKGILVGGPVPTKDEFLDGEYLTRKLLDKVIGRVDIGDSDESGLKELVTRAQDILANQEITYEKNVMQKFFETLGERRDLATLKEKDTMKALEMGAVATLFLSRETDKAIAKKLKEMAENTGAKVEIISTETEEGQQFNNLGGIGAILRFRIG